MRFAPAVLCATLLASGLSAQNDESLLLTGRETGVSVMLPKDWSFLAGKKGLAASNEDKSALVLLAELDENFRDSAMDVEETLADGLLTEVVVDKAVILAQRDRGALEGLVRVTGAGIDPHGQKVDFNALIVKVGDTTGIIVGAWKGDDRKEVVEKILEGIHVRSAGGKGGLTLTNTGTGATVTIPKGWITTASPKGLLAFTEDRTAMTLIFRPRDNFAKAVENTRTILRERVFQDIEISDFAEITAAAANKRGFARVLNASGKAKDRQDQQPVEFEVMMVQRTDKDRGGLILGAWKNADAKAQVAELLSTIRVGKNPSKSDADGDKDKK